MDYRFFIWVIIGQIFFGDNTDNVIDDINSNLVSRVMQY